MATQEELDKLREQLDQLEPEERIKLFRKWCVCCGWERPCCCAGDSDVMNY